MDSIVHHLPRSYERRGLLAICIPVAIHLVGIAKPDSHASVVDACEVVGDAVGLECV